MKNRWLIVLLVFSLTMNLAAVGTLVYFWQRPPFPDLPPPGPMESMESMGSGRGHGPAWRNPDLPVAKRREIMKLRRQFHQQAQQLRVDLQQAQDEVVQKMIHQSSQRDSIDHASKRVLAIQAEIEKGTIDHLLSIRALLNDEQWQSLLQMIERERRQMWRAPFARERKRPPFEQEKNN